MVFPNRDLLFSRIGKVKILCSPNRELLFSRIGNCCFPESGFVVFPNRESLILRFPNREKLSLQQISESEKSTLMSLQSMNRFNHNCSVIVVEILFNIFSSSHRLQSSILVIEFLLKFLKDRFSLHLTNLHSLCLADFEFSSSSSSLIVVNRCFNLRFRLRFVVDFGNLLSSLSDFQVRLNSQL